jgi:hypothetical protein
MRDGLWLPFANPDVPGHQAPSWAAGLAAQYLRACFEDEIPDMPRKDEDGNLVYNGEVVVEAGDEAFVAVEEENRDAAMQVVFDKCLSLLNDPRELCKPSAGFYGLVGPDKTGQYTNIVRKAAALPDDAELYDWAATEAQETEEEAPAPRRRSRRKKKA